MCEHYRRISENEEQRTAFFSVLASDLGVQHDAILTEAKHLSELYSQVRERKSLALSPDLYAKIEMPVCLNTKYNFLCSKEQRR